MKKLPQPDAVKLAEAARLAAIESRAELARQLLDEARKAASGKSLTENAAIQLALAEIHMEQAHTELAAQEAEEARALYEQAGSLAGRLSAEEIAPRILARQGENDRAAKRFEELAQVWANLHGPKAAWGKARCLMFITHLHRRRFRLEEGIVTGEEAVQLGRTLEPGNSALIFAASALAGIHFALACKLHPATRWASHVTSLSPSDEPEVQRHCGAALALLEDVMPSEEGYVRAMISSNLAQVLVLMGRPEEALPLMQDFLKHTQKNKTTYMEADAHMTIGWAQLAAGRPREAARSLERALKLATALEAKPLLRAIHYDLSMALESLGKLSEAMHHHNEYTHLARHGTYQPASPRKAKGKAEAVSLEPFYLKRAEAFIRGHLAGSPEIEAVAEHAGASVRAIQLAFRNYRKTTPIAFSVETRLRAARDALAGGREFESIRALCLSFGFNDASRFAREFQERFGVLPSQLMREMA